MSFNQSFEVLERRVALATIFTPLLGLVAAVIMLFGKAVSWLDLAVLLGMYCATIFGISLGYHRFFSHHSFKCRRWVGVLIGIAGAMAAQGPILFWTACHRVHHQCSDSDGDPHSPHRHGTGFVAYCRGFWHAHTGWMLKHRPCNYRRLCPDLLKERWVVALDRKYFLWVALGVLLPAVITGSVTRTWGGFFGGLVWGGLVRLFLAHHTTWSINSICHLYGKSPFPTSDFSRNNPLCALLTFGEGWHNNHHAFPASARHGLAWWEIDGSFLVIRTLGVLRLAWDIRTPTRAEIAHRRAQ